MIGWVVYSPTVELWRTTEDSKTIVISKLISPMHVQISCLTFRQAGTYADQPFDPPGQSCDENNCQRIASRSTRFLCESFVHKADLRHSCLFLGMRHRCDSYNNRLGTFIKVASGTATIATRPNRKYVLRWPIFETWRWISSDVCSSPNVVSGFQILSRTVCPRLPLNAVIRFFTSDV